MQDGGGQQKGGRGSRGGGTARHTGGRRGSRGRGVREKEPGRGRCTRRLVCARRKRNGPGRAGPGRAGLGRAGPGRAGLGRAGLGRAGLGRAGPVPARGASLSRHSTHTSKCSASSMMTMSGVSAILAGLGGGGAAAPPGSAAGPERALAATRPETRSACQPARTPRSNVQPAQVRAVAPMSWATSERVAATSVEHSLLCSTARCGEQPARRCRWSCRRASGRSAEWQHVCTKADGIST